MGFLCSSKKMKLIKVILIFHRMRTIPKLILKRKVNLKRVNKEKKLNKQKMLSQKRLKRKKKSQKRNHALKDLELKIPYYFSYVC
jgi:hypothetical protein